MNLTSTAFQNNATIPSQYTCDGTDISPPLTWQDVPANTKSLVLIVDDPDAPMGTWDHWIIFNIAPSVSSLPENITALPPGAIEGTNSFGKTNYGGPCPPHGKHRYFFKLYALDTTLPLQNNVNKKAVESAMQGHVLAQSTLIGLYQRQ